MARTTENPTTTDQPPHHPRRDRALRIVVLVAVGVASVIVLWALTEGGDRDLWVEAASALGPPGPRS